MGRHRGTVGAGRQSRSERRKSRAWSMLGSGMGTERGVGHNWKVEMGRVKNPMLQNPESCMG